MKMPSKYLYIGPVGIYGPTFQSFDVIPKKVLEQMKRHKDGEFMLLKAEGDKIFKCNRAGHKISPKAA